MVATKVALSGCSQRPRRCWLGAPTCHQRSWLGGTKVPPGRFWQGAHREESGCPMAQCGAHVLHNTSQLWVMGETRGWAGTGNGN